MAITDVGPKGEPQAVASGSAPTFAADITDLIAHFYAGRTFRKLANWAALIAATGMDDNDIAIVDTIDGATFKYDAAATTWRMHGIARFADSSARSTALPSPAVGMLSELASDGIVYRYDDSAWRPLAGRFPYVEFRLASGQTFPTGSTATVDLDASPTVAEGTWSESSGVVTVPLSGYYDIEVWGQWGAGATGIRDTTIYKNGTTDAIASQVVSAAVATFNHVERRIYLAASDTIRVRCAQNNGGNLALNEYGATKTPFLTIRYVGSR